ncbi:MAG: SRPBCC family protein [Alphaproteobacteria bacterium]|jgi:hypothetical protein|nr:SRPBCC family protein [Alphaproteobacteria bacterium]MDP6516319.1 SRPBCC family protein [Alphaproteobacteria bacterium]|tara:strand:+ start:34 stop:450 length:417 start_codon:yes stop_codon:yes gene_type:complete
MTKVSMSSKIPASAGTVWDMVKGFNDLPNWLPPIAKCESTGDGVGSKRTLTLGDGTKVVEELEEYDDGSRTFTYSIVDSPLPLTGYRSSVTIRDSGDGAEMDWNAEFEPAGAPEADVRQLVEGLYQAGFDNLKKMFGG